MSAPETEPGPAVAPPALAVVNWLDDLKKKSLNSFILWYHGIEQYHDAVSGQTLALTLTLTNFQEPKTVAS